MVGDPRRTRAKGGSEHRRVPRLRPRKRADPAETVACASGSEEPDYLRLPAEYVSTRAEAVQTGAAVATLAGALAASFLLAFVFPDFRHGTVIGYVPFCGPGTPEPGVPEESESA